MGEVYEEALIREVLKLAIEIMLTSINYSITAQRVVDPFSRPFRPEP